MRAIASHSFLAACAALVLAANVSPLPASAQDHAGMASSGEHAGHQFGQIDSDHDGRISRTEFAAAHDGKSDRFAGIDSNGDGFISQAEFDAHHAAMKPAKGDGATNPTDGEHAGHH